MTEGTKSLLIGCHNFFIHPLMVIKAWRWWFGVWPNPWQIICIFIHDIGLAGRQYLSDHTAKKGHWILGANISYILFGWKGYYFCSGHTPESNHPRSDLWYADKLSWVIAPLWWMWANYYLDVSRDGTRVSNPHQFKVWIARNFVSQNHFGAHELYLRETATLKSAPATTGESDGR